MAGCRPVESRCGGRSRGAQRFASRNRELPPKCPWRRSPHAAIRKRVQSRCIRSPFRYRPLAAGRCAAFPSAIARPRLRARSPAWGSGPQGLPRIPIPKTPGCPLDIVWEHHWRAARSSPHTSQPLLSLIRIQDGHRTRPDRAGERASAEARPRGARKESGIARDARCPFARAFADLPLLPPPPNSSPFSRFH